MKLWGVLCSLFWILHLNTTMRCQQFYHLNIAKWKKSCGNKQLTLDSLCKFKGNSWWFFNEINVNNYQSKHSRHLFKCTTIRPFSRSTSVDWETLPVLIPESPGHSSLQCPIAVIGVLSPPWNVNLHSSSCLYTPRAYQVSDSHTTSN